MGLSLRNLGFLLLFIITTGVVTSLSLLADIDPAAEAQNISLLEVLSVLDSVPEGRDLLDRAQKRWGSKSHAELLNFIKWGKVSKTDAILIRKFDPDSGIESRIRKTVVLLKKDQSFENILLDLAHELVHATSTPNWDPYDPELTPGRYIHSSIEGEGGEVAAIVAECEVSLSLAKARSQIQSFSRERCERYLSEKGSLIAREKVVNDIYRVGKYKNWVTQRLNQEMTLFPVLTGKTPELYSSTGNAPYPVALYEEYVQLTEIACENSKKRMGVVNLASADRKPAGSAPSETPLLRLLANRCAKL